jgi:hypothetical protein
LALIIHREDSVRKGIEIAESAIANAKETAQVAKSAAEDANESAQCLCRSNYNYCLYHLCW